MKRYSAAVWLFLAVAVMLAAVGFMPILRGRPMNVTFIALAVFWMIVAIASAGKARKDAASGTGDNP